MTFNVQATTSVLVSGIASEDFAERCGVCEKEGGEVFWLSLYSSIAHGKCIKLIQTSEKYLYQTIRQLFKSSTDQSHAHIRAITAVKTACGSDTILSYLEKHGENALTALFNTVGVEATKKFNRAKL